MKIRAARVDVTDHALVRWLELTLGLDVSGAKRLIANKVRNGAQLQAVAVIVDKVRFVLKDDEANRPEHPANVVVVTVLDKAEPATDRHAPRPEREIEADD